VCISIFFRDKSRKFEAASTELGKIDDDPAMTVIFESKIETRARKKNTKFSHPSVNCWRFPTPTFTLVDFFTFLYALILRQSVIHPLITRL